MLTYIFDVYLVRFVELFNLLFDEQYNLKLPVGETVDQKINNWNKIKTIVNKLKQIGICLIGDIPHRGIYLIWAHRAQPHGPILSIFPYEVYPLILPP